MEKWLTRFAAALCAVGSSALFWTFGVFFAVPWREGRLLALNASEVQVLLVPLITGAVVTWGALHILAMADRAGRPALYYTACAVLLLMLVLAVSGGMAWTAARIP